MAREKVRPYIPEKTFEKIQETCRLNGEIYDDILALSEKISQVRSLCEDVIDEIEDEKEYIKKNLEEIVETRKCNLNNEELDAKEKRKKYERILMKLDKIIDIY